jgi:hypothetical protein
MPPALLTREARRSSVTSFRRPIGSVVPAVTGHWLHPEQHESVEDSGSCHRGYFRFRSDRTRNERSSSCLAFEDAPDSLCLGFTRLLSWGYQRMPLHRQKSTTSTPTLYPSGFPSGSAFWPAVATSRSRSVFTVFHRLDGLLRR